MKIKAILANKEVKNAGWLIGGKIFQLLLSLVVGVLSARYLGPANYGLINYAAAYISFFSSLCTLGINSIIIKDFVDNPDEEGKTLGTALLLRMISSLLSAVMIVSIVTIVDAGEPLTIVIAALSSVALVFQAFDTFNYWFQSRYHSKVTAVVTLVAYAVTSLYKIVLLVLEKDVTWFAFATSLDYIVVAVLLFLFYKKNKGQRLSFSFEKAKALLSKSYHYILAGMMVAIYAQTDKFMLKQMLDESAVGYYATATALCSMWVFVLAAIIDSLYPTILRLHGEDTAGYERKNRQLYAIVFYVSLAVSLGFTVLGEPIIRILYGEAYLPALGPLRIITWYTAFSYLGVARNAWIVSENKQKYLIYIYVSAALINVALNFIGIPLWGAVGAAGASLLTQIITSLIVPAFIPALRPNVKLMIQAILLKGLKETKRSEAD